MVRGPSDGRCSVVRGPWSVVGVLGLDGLHVGGLHAIAYGRCRKQRNVRRFTGKHMRSVPATDVCFVRSLVRTARQHHATACTEPTPKSILREQPILRERLSGLLRTDTDIDTQAHEKKHEHGGQKRRSNAPVVLMIRWFGIICADHVLAMCWPCAGHVLAMCGPCADHGLGHAVCVQLKSGAQAGAGDTIGDTPLHAAANCNASPSIIARLVSSNADLEARNMKGYAIRPLQPHFLLECGSFRSQVCSSIQISLNIENVVKTDKVVASITNVQCFTRSQELAAPFGCPQEINGRNQAAGNPWC